LTRTEVPSAEISDTNRPDRGAGTFSRRTALLGLPSLGIAAAWLAPLPARAQGSAPRVIRIRAEAVKRVIPAAKATGTQNPASNQPTPKPPPAESTFFRLVAIGPDEKPLVEAGFPVFRGRQGEVLRLEIQNDLDQPTALHLRGLRGPNAQDGVPGLTGEAIPPGGKRFIEVDTRQPGTFILAPSLPATAAEQNARGLHAAVIVEEANPPPFDHDLVLAVSDWRIDDKGALAGDFNAASDTARIGRLGNRLVANAAPAPGAMEVRPGARLRVRMINVSNARMIPLKVSGFETRVYSVDSTPCQPFDPLKRTVTLSPTSRVEMVIDASAEPGKSGAIEAKYGEGIPIFAYRTAGAPLTERSPLTALTALPDPGLPPAIRLQNAARADLRIAGGIGREPTEATPAALKARFPDPRRLFTINGASQGFTAKPLLAVKRGREVVLAIFNDTAWPQVMTVHGHAFRLLHPYDDGWDPYFLDTLYLAPNTVARIAFVADNPGRWAIRSTVAEHYAAGVATWLDVT
jgi:FtsP/CotA-like multicopper oxidase with cupredoxin domain